jgi:hypothetical protein
MKRFDTSFEMRFSRHDDKGNVQVKIHCSHGGYEKKILKWEHVMPMTELIIAKGSVTIFDGRSPLATRCSSFRSSLG